MGCTDKTVCDECPREKRLVKIKEFRRHHQVRPEPDWCLLEQGIRLHGAGDAQRLRGLCLKADMRVRGCYGPPADVRTRGRAMIGALAPCSTPRTEARGREMVAADRRSGGNLLPLHHVVEHLKVEGNDGGGKHDQSARQDARRSARISIDPVTRLEGHGKIDIFLDKDGDVADCYFQVPELRGFEKFCEGRPVEEMPRITPRICGVCPEAHMMAAAKACDAVYGVDLPLTARLLRELQYNIFYVTDHTTHFYALGAPDFVMGPDERPGTAEPHRCDRKVGLEIGGQVIQCRAWGHEAAAIFGGKPVNPVNAIPGGMSKPLKPEERNRLEEICRFMVEFGKFTLKLFHDVVLANKAYVDLILNGPYFHETYSMGLVDDQEPGELLRRQGARGGPGGRRVLQSTTPREYLKHVAERVEPWSYLKFPYLKKVGWKGFVDGKDSGVYRATPQSRLNVGRRHEHAPWPRRPTRSTSRPSPGIAAAASRCTTPWPSTGHASWN